MKTTKFGVLNNVNEVLNADPIQGTIIPMLDDALHDDKVKRILIHDIYKKYNIDRRLWKNKHIYSFSINILRELLVFGEHKHIIDKIKVNNNG